MTDKITYWKCGDCDGTGKRISGPYIVGDCPRCNGSGNALRPGKSWKERTVEQAGPQSDDPS